MRKFNDQEIFDGVRHENEEVIQYLIRNYFPKIKRFVINNKGNLFDAEDVLQETLVIIFEKLRKKSLEINCQFGTYLFGIAKIVWIKELKKSARNENVEITSEIHLTESEFDKIYEKRERQKIYKEYFNKLGDECKKLLNHFFNGDKIKDITMKMGYSSDQHTKNKKYICKKHLIETIRSNPKFKEVKNERLNNIAEIPRW